MRIHDFGQIQRTQRGHMLLSIWFAYDSDDLDTDHLITVTITDSAGQPLGDWRWRATQHPTHVPSTPEGRLHDTVMVPLSLFPKPGQYKARLILDRDKESILDLHVE